MINDRYKIKKKLGSGRSQIYVCSDKYINTNDIALKVLPSPANNQEVESFRNEYFRLKKLNHPNIIKVYDYGTILSLDSEDTAGTEISLGSTFFTLDYIEGKTLDEFDHTGDPKNLFSIIAQVCSALYYLHQSNFIYYNLKPENIIIQEGENGQHIYFSDFRLTKYMPKNEPFEVHGTPHYIAPEIVQLKNVDHRADLYSLGIILYNLIYKRFPFDTDDELNIYKANIEQEFEFPDIEKYRKLIDITKILLRKSPSDRFQISLQILEELQIPFSEEMKYDWKPVITFCGRNKELFDINSIIYNKKAKEIISIRGDDGTGKSLFLAKLNHTHLNSILIKNSDILYNDRFWKVLLRKIFYTESIYNNIDDNSKNEIIELLSAKSADLTKKLRSLFLRISRNNKFVLLFDDFNQYDELSLEILKEVMPIFQVNGVKIVLTENTNYPFASGFINNLKAVELKPFSEQELDELINRNYFQHFPKTQLKKFLLKNSDLSPGNINKLISSKTFLTFIEYDFGHVNISKSLKELEKTAGTDTETQKTMIEGLSDTELTVLETCAMFNVNLSARSIALLCGIDEKSVMKAISSLIKHGIFKSNRLNLDPFFASRKVKESIYSGISSKEEKHLQAANKILESIEDFDLVECARQFEIAGDYTKSFEILSNELDTASAKSNPNYQKKLLTKLNSFPLDDDKSTDINYQLCKVLFDLNEFSECVNVADNLLTNEKNTAIRSELFVLKGKCLIRLKEYEPGISLLNVTLEGTENNDTKQHILLEIAKADLDMGKYDEVLSICRAALEEKQSRDETKANAYSMIAMVEQNRGNLAGSIYSYQSAINMYQRAGMPYNVSLMEMAIGNIIYMKGNMQEAEKHWQFSFKMNESIGNLSNEANILLNNGAFYFNTQSFDKSIEEYQRAENIFSNLGNLLGQGVALSHLGKVYLNVCEYDLALKNLELAQNILEKLDIDKYAGVVFLYGQCYFYLGDSESLKSTISNYEKLLIYKELNGMHENNIEYLKVLLAYLKGDYGSVLDFIDRVTKFYEEHRDHDNLIYYTRSKMLYIKTLIEIQEYFAATEFINESTLLKLCEEDDVLRAEREYLLGLIEESKDAEEKKPEADHFNKALKLIEHKSILELSWEINYALANFYFERSNYKRFSEFALVTKSLINFISSKISSKKMRNKYLNSFNRKRRIETLEHNEKLI